MNDKQSEGCPVTAAELRQACKYLDVAGLHALAKKLREVADWLDGLEQEPRP